MPTNDNESPMSDAPHPPSDAHGRAALLLVESLIHGLCEKSVLTAAEAAEIAKRAVDIAFEQVEAADSLGAPAWRSHALLSSIARSLRIDGDSPLTPPRPIS